MPEGARVPLAVGDVDGAPEGEAQNNVLDGIAFAKAQEAGEAKLLMPLMTSALIEPNGHGRPPERQTALPPVSAVQAADVRPSAATAEGATEEGGPVRPRPATSGPSAVLSFPQNEAGRGAEGSRQASDVLTAEAIQRLIERLQGAFREAVRPAPYMQDDAPGRAPSFSAVRRFGGEGDRLAPDGQEPTLPLLQLFHRADLLTLASDVRSRLPAPLEALIQRIVYTARDEGSHRLSLRLVPESLGTLDVQIDVRGAQVALSIVAHSEAGRRLIEAHIDQLRAQLLAQGLVLERLTLERSAELLAPRSALEVAPDGRQGGREQPSRDPRRRPERRSDPLFAELIE